MSKFLLLFLSLSLTVSYASTCDEKISENSDGLKMIRQIASVLETSTVRSSIKLRGSFSHSIREWQNSGFTPNQLHIANQHTIDGATELAREECEQRHHGSAGLVRVDALTSETRRGVTGTFSDRVITFEAAITLECIL